MSPSFTWPGENAVKNSGFFQWPLSGPNPFADVHGNPANA